MTPTTSRNSSVVAALTLSALALSGCNKDGGGGAQGPPGGMPPMSVKLLTLEQKPIEQTSEFIATLRSLRTTTIQPDVEGYVKRIFVKSGQRVSEGTLLVQINQDKQAAAVQSTEANRAGIEADVQYWRQQVKRLEALVDAGAISRAEFDQAQNSLRTAEARLATLDAEVKQGRVDLSFYRITAPQAGVVGDIPIREGDRVTAQTVITTIDQNDALEVYVEVPLDRAPELRLGLPVQILDVDGKVVATNAVTFVAPRVETGTQSILVKALLKDAPPKIREQQFVKARIIWRSAPGVTVPVVAVTRISGQYFCFVAEQQGNNLVAKQRPLQLGEVYGDDYVVVSGLKAGDRVVVSGIQKLGDGAPIKAE